MKILGENENRDLYMGPNNQLVLLTGLDATLQACESAIEAQRGEIQYDVTRGIPTESTAWAGVPNQQQFRFFCVEALKAISGVEEVIEFETVIEDNTLTYAGVIRTEFGTGEIGNTISGL